MEAIGRTAGFFLPFAAAYFLSYVFRTINAVIAGQLTTDLSLDAAHLGLLTSSYFLTFAVVQLPVGAALDRWGPRRVQIVLLCIAAAGAALFAEARSLGELIFGRALIGLGVAGGLMAGLKAIILFLPRERVGLANGCFIALGTAGAVAATAPAEALLTAIGWRDLFMILAALTVGTGVAICLFVPKPALAIVPRSSRLGIGAAFRSQKFWRLAPLSTSCVGTAWALQGLWAAPWLSDVAALSHSVVVHHLLIMGLSLCGGALLLGIAADRLRRLGITPGILLGTFASCFIAAEFALVLRLPVGPSVPWAIIAAMGSATVLSYAILAEYFVKEVAGRANAALNLLHIGGAFALQSGIGLIIQAWPADAVGHYPAAAYAAAFLAAIVLQAACLMWFIISPRPARSSQTLPGLEQERVISEALADRERARAHVITMVLALPTTMGRYIPSRFPRNPIPRRLPDVSGEEVDPHRMRRIG